MTQQPSLIAQVEKLHVVVALLAVLATVALAGKAQVAGMLAGALVGAGNFRALGVLTSRLVGGETGSRNAAIGLLLAKFTLLAALLGAIVTWVRPDIVALLIGLTLAPACLVVLVLRSRRSAPLETL